MSRLITHNLRDELARLVGNLEGRGQRVRPLSVGAPRHAFGGLSVGAMTPSSVPQPGADSYAAPAEHCGEGGCGGAMDVRKYLDEIGYPPCRMWGADPPGGRDALGCPTRKKLCIIPMPLFFTVTGLATGVTYEPLAKVWFWPLMYVDAGSGTDITVDALTYTGDSVTENGLGSGPWSPSALFPADGNYNVMPGLPAIDNSNGIRFTLSNANAADRNLDGQWIGVSIRN